jgi:hypothetical protein
MAGVNLMDLTTKLLIMPGAQKQRFGKKIAWKQPI